MNREELNSSSIYMRYKLQRYIRNVDTYDVWSL